MTSLVFRRFGFGVEWCGNELRREVTNNARREPEGRFDIRGRDYSNVYGG